MWSCNLYLCCSDLRTKSHLGNKGFSGFDDFNSHINEHIAISTCQDCQSLPLSPTPSAEFAGHPGVFFSDRTMRRLIGDLSLLTSKDQWSKYENPKRGDTPHRYLWQFGVRSSGTAASEGPRDAKIVSLAVSMYLRVPLLFKALD
jgi:hypothetical protein